MKRNPPEHWVCFSCRKQFRKASRWDGVLWDMPGKPREVAEYSCPECKGPMVNMGKYFQPPRRANKRGWEQMRLLGEHGIRFHSEGAVSFRRMIVGPSPGVRQTKMQIAACPCHTHTQGQRLLRKMEQDKQQKALKRKAKPPAV